MRKRREQGVTEALQPKPVVCVRGWWTVRRHPHSWMMDLNLRGTVRGMFEAHRGVCVFHEHPSAWAKGMRIVWDVRGPSRGGHVFHEASEVREGTRDREPMRDE
jgi:hypothetical protein